MLDITQYCKNNLIVNIFEKNEKIFPQPGKSARFEIFTGDHCRDRQGKRKVTDKEIIEAFWGAYKEIERYFKEGKIDVAKAPYKDEESTFVIVDARKDKASPINIAAFIYRNFGKNKLKYPAFIVKTVYNGPNFSGNIYDKNAARIILY